MKPYAFTKPMLHRQRTARWVYPWPLSRWDALVGEERERQQADLALYWRRAYQARQKSEAA